MLDQYGSVLCVACTSSMRLATIEPGEAGTSMVMFDDGRGRVPDCNRNGVRLFVMGDPYRFWRRLVLTGLGESNLAPKSALDFHPGAMARIV
jgi:hypothetical protein